MQGQCQSPLNRSNRGRPTRQYKTFWNVSPNRQPYARFSAVPPQLWVQTRVNIALV